MSKNVSVSLLADIRSTVRTLAMCVEIRRQDGRTYRITNHDQSITYEGYVYDHKRPFTLSAISTTATFGVDNLDMTLALDDEVFTLEDFERGAYKHAEVSIILVNYEAPDHGRIIMRRGWTGAIDTNKYGLARITIYGLLKILDLEVGRIFQPSCDADFGDKRCKMAVNYNQTYSHINTRYHVGQWVYQFERDAAVKVTLDNGDFTAGATSPGTDIPGWTTPDNMAFEVLATDGDLPPYSGGLALYGASNTKTPPYEAIIYKDVQLTGTAGPDVADIDPADIDAGKISVGLFALMGQTVYLLDPVRLVLEVRDADGEVIDISDTGYIRMEEHGNWYSQNRITTLLSGARSVRIYIYFRIDDGVVINCAVDNVEFYWWKHFEYTPWADVIHRVERIVAFDADSLRRPLNASFESGGSTIANSNTAPIVGWVRPNTTADWWRVVSAIGTASVIPAHGSFSLRGGDDSSGTQKTYMLTSTTQIADLGMTPELVDDIAVVAKIQMAVTWVDTESAAAIDVDFIDGDGVTILSSAVMDFRTRTGSVPYREDVTSDYTVPPTTRSIKITVQARSPASSSAANVAFDDLRFYVFNGTSPTAGDKVYGYPKAGTVFAPEPQGWTMDGTVLWRAYAHVVGYDTVTAVASRKEFTADLMSGGPEEYVTSIIRWISGQNRGQTNLIRIWNDDSAAVKLYFNTVYPIQIGDAFEYVLACQKSLDGDCLARFNNVINYRGFPYLPGKLTDN